jgi:phosphomannomutase
MHITEEIKLGAIERAKKIQVSDAIFAGLKVLRVETMDGIKFFLDNAGAKNNPKTAETWLLLRASGTEPLLRVYCEAPSKETVQKVLAAAEAFVLNGAKA